MKAFLKKHLFGVVSASVITAATLGFIVLLWVVALLPIRYLLLAAAVLLMCALIVCVLLWDKEGRGRRTVGIILAAILLLCEGLAGYMLGAGAGTLNKITSPQMEYAEFGIYVRKDDPAKSLEDAKNYTFGILDPQDRATTDRALKKLAEKIGVEPKYKMYSGVDSLMDAVLNAKEVDAVLLNKGFIDLLTELEGHEKDMENLRELLSLQAETDIPVKEETEASDKVFTVFISGIDNRGGLVRKSRSDVNILATVNVETGKVLLVSTPRDYYVPLSISDGIPDKLTHAGIYGVDVSKDTVGMLYGVEIDYYFRVNFSGFKKIIDALGGITVNSDYTFPAGHFQITKGPNEMDGEMALAFSRERKRVPGGERQRGIHQMAVISAVIGKLTSPALLKNYTEVLDGISSCFETDMPYDTIASLVRRQLDKGTGWTVTSFAVNGTGATRKPYSLATKAYVMIPDEKTVEQAKQMISDVMEGK